ncbi:MAG TPA: hypothetical protein VG268_10690, partial [Streptosporangiaceae bacterium]|nr:hypothetical protein [Streptosporangiaceae bacterium]
HARLPGLGEQLGVQAGVLGHHFLELAVGSGYLTEDLLARLVLVFGLLATPAVVGLRKPPS